MAQGIYVASAEPLCFKSNIVLGMMELLRSQTHKVGFFKPVVMDARHDATIHLITNRYKIKKNIECMYGVTHTVAHELIASNQYDELIKRIMVKYRSIEAHCDIMLCAGTDFGGVTDPLEFDFNVDVANNLGCLMMTVMRGYGRNLPEMCNALSDICNGLAKRKCEMLAVVVNRVAPLIIEDTTAKLRQVASGDMPLYTVSDSAPLWMPTVREIASAIDARFLIGEEFSSKHEVTGYKVAAMELPNFLKHLEEGTLVITPGDRSDILLGSIMAHASTTYPRIAGIIVTGDLLPAPSIQKLINGFTNNRLPLLSVRMDTFSAAIRVSTVEGVLGPENPRKIAAALGLFESGVNVKELSDRLKVTKSTRITPLMFEYELIQRAKSHKQHIVLPEGTETRILQAAEMLLLRQVCDITLLGDEQKIRQKISELDLGMEGVKIINPATSKLRQEYGDIYYQLRKHKGISHEVAVEVMGDSSYFGTMMVYRGDADGMVSGSVNTTAHTIRPALEFIKTKPGCDNVSSVFLMCVSDKVQVFGDCAINPNPNEKELADIAISSADTAAAFGIKPKVAMLSYSTGESGKGKDVDKVKLATAIVKTSHPELMIEGPLQFDAASDPDVARIKLPGSKVAGQATVFIFPDLNTGNNTYKAVQRSANAVAIGPVLQGLNKPVNDLSRGCTIPDIVNTVAITAIQAQASKRHAPKPSDSTRNRK